MKHCTAVGSAVLPHMTLYAFRNPCVVFPDLTAGVVCSERVSVRGEHLTGDDSIAYDGSFA